MRTKIITFANRKGLELSGRLELPAEGRASQFVLFAHCFTCNKDLNAVRNISRALSGRGFGVLRFDFTGLGRSEGEFKDSHFSANIEDLIDASAFLEREYQAPSVIIGHSLGGAAAIVAASQLDSIKAVVTIGSPADPEHVEHLLGDHPEAGDEPFTVNIGGRPFKIDKGFVEHLKKQGLKEILAKSRKAILVCHSPQDAIVGIDNAAQIYSAAHHPKSFLSLDGADHLLTAERDSLYVGRMIAAWVERYLPVVEDDLHTDAQAVVSLSEPGFTSKVKSGKHRLIADEPKSVGGLDMGPAPYDFVSIGLAACTAMTIRMYTERKGWPIAEVNVHVSHRKLTADELSQSEGQEDRPDLFDRTVELVGDLDEKQVARILQIANKCPVHKTLEGGAQVKTELLD